MNLSFRPISTVLLLAFAGTFAQAQPAAATESQPQLDLQRATLQAGRQKISVQLARTPQQRQTGLMHRRSMPQQEGMLFVFDQPGVQCFWMKNTLLPLTAAFVDDDGTIVNLADMQPQTETPHCSARPVRYVLEMNQGWFKRHGVKAGTQLKWLQTAPAAAKAGS